YGFVGPGLGSLSGWRVEPAHFAERHGLIIIIAIGESLAALGIGARGTGLGGSVIVAVVLGLVIAASFWLAYFDFFSVVVQQLLSERSREQRTSLDRDVCTTLHLPTVAGLVVVAFGMH